MPKSENLGLELTTDNTITFGDWRKAINGNNDGVSTELSNMQIIDKAIGNIEETLSTILGV